MKTLIASLIATSFAVAPAFAADTTAYDKAASKAQADFRTASNKCDALSGNKRDVCREEAKLKRARAELDAATKHDKDRMNAARRNVIQAEHEVAEEKCEVLQGEAQDDCEDKADDVRDKALAKLGDGDMSAVGASAAGQTATSDDRAAAKAIERCEKMTGDDKTACVMDNKGNMTAGAAAGAGATLGERTREALHNVKEKTKDAFERAGDKTRDVAAGTADKTENAADRAGRATSDAAITSKVKASLVAEKDLSGMEINVDTEKGVVMLSGFVESKAEADKAVRVAKGVEGVTSVKSAIKVK